MSNRVFYLHERMEPTTDIAKTYRTLMQHVKAFNDYLSGPTIDLKSFQDLYGILYFDLTNQAEELKSGSTKLELKYTLSGNPNANSVCMRLFYIKRKSV